MVIVIIVTGAESETLLAPTLVCGGNYDHLRSYFVLLRREDMFVQQTVDRSAL